MSATPRLLLAFGRDAEPWLDFDPTRSRPARGVVAAATANPLASWASLSTLRRGGAAIDAIEASIRMLEDDPLFNAGRGAVFNSAGGHELDAAIMEGRNKGCGAVCAVRTGGASRTSCASRAGRTLRTSWSNSSVRSVGTVRSVRARRAGGAFGSRGSPRPGAEREWSAERTPSRVSRLRLRESPMSW